MVSSFQHKTALFVTHRVQNNSMLVEGHDMNCRRWKNCPLSVFQALNIQNLVLTLVNVDISGFEKVKFCIVTLSNTKLSKKYINWPLHPCTKRCFRRRGRTNNPCYPLSWSPGCGSPCNLFWWPGTKKSRWHQVPNCSITWLPSFLPVFSAFWVVVCALENSKRQNEISFVFESG